jgi:hypothetical protein
MTMDRREFVTTSLAAITAAVSPLAQSRGGDSGSFVELFFKGQFVYITEGRELYIAALKETPGHPPHNALVYVQQNAIDPSRTLPAPDDQVGDGPTAWKGWKLTGEITLVGSGGSRVRLRQPAAVAPGSRRRAPWPTPVNSDAAWNDHAYIPQLASIVPGCKVKDRWRDECRGYCRLDASKLRPRKPCTPADVVGVWAWRTASGELTHTSAVTDLVSYPILALPPGAKLTLRVGERSVPIVVNGASPLAFLCAPGRSNPPARQPYGVSTKRPHFSNVYRVLEPATFPEMEYLTQSASPGSVQGTVCYPPYSAKDDDIFCPGGEPPPRP